MDIDLLMIPARDCINTVNPPPIKAGEDVLDTPGIDVVEDPGDTKAYPSIGIRVIKLGSESVRRSHEVVGLVWLMEVCLEACLEVGRS